MLFSYYVSKAKRKHRKTKGAVLTAPFILVKQMRIAAIDNFLPTVKGVGVCIVRLDNIYNQNCKTEYYRRNKSPLEESSVRIGGLILTIEGLCAAGDRAGKTILITFLKNNCNYDKRSRNEKQYKKYDFENFHFSLPFILFPTHVGMIHKGILPQRK